MPEEKSPGRPTTRRYTDNAKAQAGRLVCQLRNERVSDYGSIQRVASQLGYGLESVRSRVRQADIHEGLSVGTLLGETARINAFEQENRELRRADAILRSASAFSRRSSTAHRSIVAYIDDHRAEFGVEPICEGLQVAPSTYYAAMTRPPSARQQRDEVTIPALVALWHANSRVYRGAQVTLGWVH